MGVKAALKIVYSNQKVDLATLSKTVLWNGKKYTYILI